MKALKWSQHFSHCKSMGIFSDALERAANSAVNGRIWPNFELIRDFMGVLVDLVQMRGTSVVSSLLEGEMSRIWYQNDQ